MTNPKPTVAITFGAILAMVLSISVAVFAGAPEKPADYDPTDGWDIPPPVENIENPVDDNDDARSQGERLYERECASCHGDSGQGDGPDASDLDDFPGDFTSDAFAELPDGVIFFMTKEGKDDMPAYDGDLTDQQIWQVIRYIRTLE